MRYGHQTNSLRGFSRKHGITSFASLGLSTSPLGVIGGADLPTPPAYRLVPGCPTPGLATLLRPPFGRTFTWWYGNINPFSITYGFRPRLRGRLTLSRLTLLRNPWAYGESVSHRLSRYSCPHRHFQGLHPSSPSGFTGNWNAPLPRTTLTSADARSFGIALEPRYILGAGSLDQ